LRPAAVAIIAAAIALSRSLAETEQEGDSSDSLRKKLRWFTPPYYHDGRQRAQLVGDSSQGGPWIDRVKMTGGAHVLAHTHTQDELVTVIEGTWYLGRGSEISSQRS